MIIGIGTDIVSIARIERLLSEHPERFVQKYFTQNERDNAPKANLSGHYAKRFAAKEAFVKGLGTGFREGISWQEIEVSNDDLGKPFIALTGNALTQLNRHFKKGHELVVHLSLSDEQEFAQAYVVIERVSTV